MIGKILKNTFGVFKKKPVTLWGLSLLYAVIAIVILTLGVNVPIIAIPVILTLYAGMSVLFLNGYTGAEVSSRRLFDGFARENIARVTGGMCWYKLWSVIWSFVPVAGIIRLYSYRFTPYILLKRPDIKAMDALKLSQFETKGHKAAMFLMDLIIAAAVLIIFAVIALLTLIPYVRIVFIILGALLGLAVMLVLPMFTGIVYAAFYHESKMPASTANSNAPSSDWSCNGCGTVNAAGTSYCRSCGEKYDR